MTNPLIPIKLLCSILVITKLTACELDKPSTQNHYSSTAQVQTNSADDTTVIDFSGRKFKFSTPVKRIVALAPHIVENLYSIGAGDLIVGVVSHSDYPKEALELPIVGGYKKINFEAIMALEPDVVIGWTSGNSTDILNKVEELGIPVILDQPDTLEDIATSLRMLGRLTGLQTEADTKATEFSTKLSSLRAANHKKPKIKTFYQVWNDPLITINGNHIISDAIETCGGLNVFSSSVATAPRTNIESVIVEAPEAIIASGMGTARPEWLDDWKQWDVIPAVSKGNLFFVNPDHLQRHTVRQLQAIETICAQLDQARSKNSKSKIAHKEQ